MEEQWKDVVGYEKIYEVSNLGQVRNYHTGKIMKARLNIDGYLIVNLSKEKKKFTLRVHRLVANAFIPNDNEAYNLIDHINRIRTDNSVSNLRWVDNRMNSLNRGIGSCNKSGVKGVFWYEAKQKWTACIKSNGKQIHGGYFEDFNDAVKRREELEKIHFENTV